MFVTFLHVTSHKCHISYLVGWKGLRFVGSSEVCTNIFFQLCSVPVWTQFITKLPIWGDAQLLVSFVLSCKSEHPKWTWSRGYVWPSFSYRFQRMWWNFKPITENPEMKLCGHNGKAKLEGITHSFYAQNSLKSATFWSNNYGM